MSGCPSQTFTSKEGVVSSPNYPDFLLPGLDCTFDILAPAGKRLQLGGYRSVVIKLCYGIVQCTKFDHFFHVGVVFISLDTRNNVNK